MPKTKEEKLATARAWKARNKERVKAARAAHYATNKEKELTQAKEWRGDNQEYLKAFKKKSDARYREENLAKIKATRRQNRHKLNTQRRLRYATDPIYVIQKRLRVSLTQALRVASTKKTINTMNLIGCTGAELKAYLESKFLPGMSWEERHLIHIDHIRPIASFDLADSEHQRQCFHFTNLRPLWAIDNMRKGTRWPHIT